MFDIEKFNLVEDDKYYYVFRSLEAGDISDINNGITDVMRTDRERYKREPKYKEDSNISLEEMFDHIKIHYRQDTNCISFTTSAAVASLYGRDTDSFEEGVFNDKYVILKIPKDELGKNSFFAPQYFIEQINEYLNKYYESANESVKNIFELIDKCETQEQLDDLKSFRFSNSVFEGGIEFETTNSSKYATLTSEQNLAKNKLIAKIDLLPENILGNATNKFLVQTLGSAFASMEVTHYQSISSEYLIDCPTYILDIFSILQQSNNIKIKEIEKIIIDKLSNNELNDLEPFKYYNYEITDEDLAIDKLYSISDNGKVDYNTMKNLYIKTFYLAKSKLRAYHSVKLLRNILGNSYDDVLSELLDTYGIEPKITNKQSINKINISDSIGLSYSTEIERNLFYIVNNDYSNIKDLEVLINSKEDCVSIVMMDLLNENNTMSKEYYYCNAIIDAFDWKQFNIKSIALRHRNNLIKKLKESNFMDLYDRLKNKNYSSKDISRIILSNIIKNNKEIDLESSFTIEELQDYLGYFRLKNSNLKLTRYQANAVTNMQKAYLYHNYTNVILPTGTGKSYVAISEILNYLNNGQKVLYLAPDNEILYQIKYYLVSEILGDNFLESNIDNIIKKYYPSLYLSTYPNLQRGIEGEKLLVTNFDFIVMDELHRTGASEWKDALETLYKNQNDKCKILGITATPTRDCDGVDMAEYWASFFGYTDEEIYSNQHLAYNMDFNQAVALGYLANPRVINCDYEFLTKSDEIKNYVDLVEKLKDEEQKQKIFSKLKNDIANAQGVSKILKENINSDDRCLVFCPRVDFDETTGTSLMDKEKIDKYKRKLEEIYGKDNIECYSMLASYSDNTNQKQLESFNNSSSNKIKFMLVLDKMNEGKHGKYNKLIWFRALGDNSFVLCSQQLGRISKLIKSGQILSDEERPLAIDLPNNLLRIQNDSKLKKSIKSDDISRFKLVVDWIKEYNKIPNINSKDCVESNMAGILKVIIFFYHKKVFDLDSIKNIKKRYQAKEIKRLAEELDFDIWNLYLPNRTKETKKRKIVPYYAKVNPIYRDYVSNLEKLRKASLSIEERLEEIYDYHKKNSKLPTEDNDVRFSDNSAYMAKWIFFFKDKIISLANEGNQYAKFIVEIRKWGMSKDEILNLRLNELYDICIRDGGLPDKSDRTVKFKDGQFVANWLNLFSNKFFIANECIKGNEKAKFIAEKMGLNINLTIERGNKDIPFEKDKVPRIDRFNELYDLYKSGLDISMEQFGVTFNDGVSAYEWVTKSWNRKFISELAKAGNKKAIELAGILDIKFDKRNLSNEEKIEEIYQKYKERNFKIFPKQDDKSCVFSNGDMMGSFLNRKDVQKYILAFSKINPKAMVIALNKQIITKEEALKYYDINYEIEPGVKLFNCIELLNRVDELIFFIKNSGALPKRKNDNELESSLFSWTMSNKKALIEYAKFEKKCLFVCIQYLWVPIEYIDKYKDEPNFEIKKDGKTIIINLYKDNFFEKKIRDCFEFYNAYDRLPQQNDNVKEACNLGNFISQNKEGIISLAPTNPYAMFICLRQGTSLDKSWIKKDEALKYYSNDYKIEGINLFTDKTLSDEDKINEIFELLKNDMLTNKSAFSDGSTIVYWKKNNESKIKNAAYDGNDKAMYICLDHRKGAKQFITDDDALRVFPEDYIVDGVYLFSKDKLHLNEHIEQTYNYLQTMEINDSLIFDDGIIVKKWLEQNKKDIISLASKDNEKEAFICDKLGWIVKKEEKPKRNISNLSTSFEDRIDSIIDYYIRNNKMPEREACINETYGFNLESFLHSYRDLIIEQAYTNVKCMFICLRAGAARNKNWIKIEDALNIYPDKTYIEFNIDGVIKHVDLYEKTIVQKRIDEIYSYYVATGILYNQNSKEFFKDGSGCIGFWIKNNKKHILKEAEMGNERAKTIVDNSEWTSTFAPKIANINLYALEVCLSKGWLLEKDVEEYPTYQKYKAFKK